jgi:hypothetical protein
VLLFDMMRDRIVRLELRVKELEDQQSNSASTAKLKLVQNDGRG